MAIGVNRRYLRFRGQTSENREQRSGVGGEKNDEARMTNDEGMMQLKWSFPDPAHAHNPNRGSEDRDQIRGHTSDVGCQRSEGRGQRTVQAYDD